MDLSNAHLTPASQVERWIKKIQKLQKKNYVFIIFIITKFGDNFEEKIDICFFLNVFFGGGWSGSQKVWLTAGISSLTPPIMKN